MYEYDASCEDVAACADEIISNLMVRTSLRQDISSVSS